MQASYNRAQREKLISAAKAEMKKQDIKRQAKEADEEVLKWLRLLSVSMTSWYSQLRLYALTSPQQYKQKKKTPSKKEKDAAWKAIRNRNSIYSQLDS